MIGKLCNFTSFSTEVGARNGHRGTGGGHSGGQRAQGQSGTGGGCMELEENMMGSEDRGRSRAS